MKLPIFCWHMLLAVNAAVLPGQTSRDHSTSPESVSETETIPSFNTSIMSFSGSHPISPVIPFSAIPEAASSRSLNLSMSTTASSQKSVTSEVSSIYCYPLETSYSLLDKYSQRTYQHVLQSVNRYLEWQVDEVHKRDQAQCHSPQPSY